MGGGKGCRSGYPLGPRQIVHLKPHGIGRVHFARGYTGSSTVQPDQASQCRISASEARQGSAMVTAVTHIVAADDRAQAMGGRSVC